MKKMKKQKININGIPAIIWGEKAEQIYLYVHGKMSCKEYAEDFAHIAERKHYQTISFDLPEHGERKEMDVRCDIWSGMHDLSMIADYTFLNWQEVSLYACSLGAYFSLQTYADRPFTKCLFQSPMLDMEYMIKQMFTWFHVTEERLYAEKEIATPFENLRLDYYQYVLEHPVKNWHIPTSILFGGKDHLQTLEIMQDFVKAHDCKLEVFQDSDHAFLNESDMKIVQAWLEERI